MKYKKIIAVALVLGILLSSINVAFTGALKDGKIKSLVPFISNFSSKKPIGTIIGHNNVVDMKSLKATKSKEMTMKLPKKNEVVVSGTKKSLTKNQNGNDLFSYSQQDIENLLNKGYSIEDIIKADEVGNRIKEEPLKLLESKIKSKQDWASVEENVVVKRKQHYLDNMKIKKPDIYNKLKKEKFTTDDMVQLFAYINNNKVTSIDSVITDYKAKGKDALKSKESDNRESIVRTKLDKYGLKDEDVRGLSDDMLAKIEMVSESKGIPVKEMMKEINAKLQEAGRK